MKLLHLTHSLNPAGGGTVTFIQQLIEAHRHAGDVVELACLDEPDGTVREQSGAPVHFFGPAVSAYGFCPRLLPWLKEHKSDYDCVVVHGIWQYPSLAVWLALGNSKVPYVVFPHGMLDPWFKRAYPLKHLKKLLYWNIFERRVLKDAAAVLFTSAAELAGARKDFNSGAGRDFVVGAGLKDPPADADAQKRQFFGEFPGLEGERFFLYLSRIHPKKGCDLLLSAFCALPSTCPVHLVMAGPGDCKYVRLLQEKMEHLPGSRGKLVTWAGMLSGEAKWGALRAADALVLPSHQENFGMVVAESLACFTPVLISNKVDIWQEVLDDKAGFVESDDRDGTRRLLERFLALAGTEQAELRENARRCFLSRFAIKESFARYMDVLRQIKGVR